jgi:hypothetical protein
MIRRGNTGGNRALREVFPLDGIHSRGSLCQKMGIRARRLPPQLQVAPQVTSCLSRAALCAARWVAPLSERSPTAITWRERPPEMAVWSAKPAASDLVAHATAEGCWRPVPAPSIRCGRGEFDAESARELAGFLDALFALAPAIGSERLTPRG